MRNTWSVFEKNQPCNFFIDGKYEIHIERNYAVVKRLSDEMMFRITGESLKFVSNLEVEKISYYLDQLNIPQKNEKSCQKTLLKVKINSNSLMDINACLWIPILIGTIALFLITEFWYGFSGIRGFEEKRSVLYFTFLILNIAMHELGHIVFCIASGRKVKGIGIKLNYYIPMFFVDTSDICMRSKKYKVLTSLGGVYFNSLIGLTVIIIGYVIDNAAFQSLSYISFFFVISNLVPFIKLDGYYIIADIMDVNNLEKTSKIAFRNYISKKNTNNNQKSLCVYYGLDIIFKLLLCLAIGISVITYFGIDLFASF